MKLANEAQVEQLREIGAYLRKRREDKSISINEIAAHTRIRPAFIQAIEEGNAEILPEAVFVQGFIRRYCDAIGVDGTTLTANFGDVFLPVVTENQSVDTEKKSSLYIPLAVPYIFLLAAASFGLFHILAPKQGGESAAQSKSTTNQKAVATFNASPSPTSSPTTSPSPSPLPVTTPLLNPSPTLSPISQVPEGVEVGIEVQDSSWIRVKVDGKTDFEGTLKKGDKKTWTAQKEVVIRSGNAGAILVSPNKQPATAMGTEGSVKEIKYTPETSTPTPTSTPTSAP
ncbi:MAG: helix-turn-helix domain-containing protein [Calothrix sp. C42_A2020_038]|nr:helix-turn-helix domain-containing protein [Calothrix sp. C42_A2020_038]